jgi:hypothetical protein
MYISILKEEPKKQEDVAWRKEGNKEEAESTNSRTDSVNFGSGPNYQIKIPIGWALGEGNV